MSRSYKKVPYSGDNKGKNKKRIANHSVRAWLKQHPNQLLQKNDYKKVYDSWDICDYYCITSWEKFWDQCLKRYEWEKSFFPDRNITPPDKTLEYKRWLKYHKNK